MQLLRAQILGILTISEQYIQAMQILCLHHRPLIPAEVITAKVEKVNQLKFGRFLGFYEFEGMCGISLKMD